MAEQDSGVAGAQILRRLHKHISLGRQGRASHKPCKSRSAEHCYRDDYVCHAASQDSDDGDCQNNAWERKQRIADSHDDGVQKSAVVSA